MGDPVGWPRDVDRAIHRPSWQFTLPRQSRPVGGNLKVLLDYIRARRFPIMQDSSAGGAPNPKVWIYDQIIFLRQRKYEPLNQLHRELARVNRFLSVVVFNVRNYPYVAGVLAQRITGILADFCAFVILLARVLLWHPDSVEVKNIIVCLRKPQDGFITAGEAALAMQAVFERPDDVVPKFRAENDADSS